MSTHAKDKQLVTIQETLPDIPTTAPHVVIVGGGFGGLSVAKTLDEQVRVTLIDANNFHLFQPMLYQVATAGLDGSDIATPLRAILRQHKNTSIIMAEVTGIDTQEQQVLMEDHYAIHYDYLVLATGATNNYFGHPEWANMAPGMKSLDEALEVRRLVLSAFEAADREPDPEKRQSLLTFVLVGGGATGVELAGAMAELSRCTLQGNFRNINPGDARIILVEGKSRVMPSFPAALTRQTQRKLQQMGVEIRTGVHVKEVTPDGVMIGDQHVVTENVIWTAGVKASPAGKWLDVETDHDGRVKVQPDLTVPGHPNIFVIGDTALATQNGKPLPGLAPVAIQEGHYVAHVITNHASGKTQQRPFHYLDKGTMATVGRSFGVVDIGPLHFAGRIAWFFWLIVHILFLIGFRNRFIVLFQYAWAYLTFQRGARVILPGKGQRTP